MQFEIKAFSEKGNRHKKNGVVNQDAVFSITSPDMCIIAAADGASCRRYSAEGAKIAAREVCRFIYEHFDELVENENEKRAAELIRAHILDFIQKHADKKNCFALNFASTLLAAAYSSSTGKLLCFHIGDGTIYFQGKESWRVASLPKGTGNATYFTTSYNDGGTTESIITNTDDIYGVALSTDGADSTVFDNQCYFLKNNDKNITKLLNIGCCSQAPEDDHSFISCRWNGMEGII